MAEPEKELRSPNSQDLALSWRDPRRKWGQVAEGGRKWGEGGWRFGQQLPWCVLRCVCCIRLAGNSLLLPLSEGTLLSGEEPTQDWVLGSRAGQALGLGFISSQTLWKLRVGTQGARQALEMQL